MLNLILICKTKRPTAVTIVCQWWAQLLCYSSNCKLHNIQCGQAIQKDIHVLRWCIAFFKISLWLWDWWQSLLGLAMESCSLHFFMKLSRRLDFLQGKRNLEVLICLFVCLNKRHLLISWYRILIMKLSNYHLCLFARWWIAPL